MVINTPRVAMTRTSELARRNGFMIHQWVHTPSQADHRIPAMAAGRKGHPNRVWSSHWANTPAMAVAPREKLSTPVPR